MNNQRIIGIDPGLSGGLACIDETGALVALNNMPLRAKLHGRGQQVDGYELSTWLLEAKGNCPCVAVVEGVNSSPQMGVCSAFSFGEGVGIIQGVLQTLGIPYRQVTPTTWKRAAGLIGRPKDASRALAMQTWPDFSDTFKRRSADGLAEACLIGKFGGR